MRFQAAKAKAKWTGVRASAETSLNSPSHLISVQGGNWASSLPVLRTSMSSHLASFWWAAAWLLV